MAKRTCGEDIRDSSGKRRVARGAGYVLTAIFASATPVAAEPDADEAAPIALDANKVSEPMRIRVAAGPQFQPAFPGDDRMTFQPLAMLSRARGDRPFPFGAPRDGNGLTLFRLGPLEVGPMLRLEGRRRSRDLGGDLPEVDRTVEVGGFTQLWFGEHVRLRADLRKGLGGHKGWVSQIGADAVARDGDRWLVSLGPRFTLSDQKYQRAWFGVTPATAATTGLTAYDPQGGAQSIGAVGRGLLSFNERWGMVAQFTYARLIDDAERSPIIRRADSADQFGVGVGLTYTFSIH